MHDDHSSTVQQSQLSLLVDRISSIAATDMQNEPTPEACNGYSAPLSRLPDGLFHKVLACGD